MAFSLYHHISFIRETHATLSKNWVINICTKLSLLLIAVQVIAIAISWKNLPPMVPLWYSLPWGDEQLASPIWLTVLPGGSIAWQIISFITNVYVTRDHLIFAQILSLASCFLSLFSCIVLVSIVSLIT